MLVALVQGFVAGGSLEQGSAILGLAWGRVTLVDLGGGFMLVGMWMAWREASAVRAAPWLAALLAFGNLTAAVYVAPAAGRAGDPATLLLGPRRH